MTRESYSGNVAVFEGRRIRKVLHDGEWWLSIIDVIEVLTKSSIPKRYWTDLKKNWQGKEQLNRTKKSYGSRGA